MRERQNGWRVIKQLSKWTNEEWLMKGMFEKMLLTRSSDYCFNRLCVCACVPAYMWKQDGVNSKCELFGWNFFISYRFIPYYAWIMSEDMELVGLNVDIVYLTLCDCTLSFLDNILWLFCYCVSVLLLHDLSFTVYRWNHPVSPVVTETGILLLQIPATNVCWCWKLVTTDAVSYGYCKC